MAGLIPLWCLCGSFTKTVFTFQNQEAGLIKHFQGTNQTVELDWWFSLICMSARNVHILCTLAFHTDLLSIIGRGHGIDHPPTSQLHPEFLWSTDGDPLASSQMLSLQPVTKAWVVLTMKMEWVQCLAHTPATTTCPSVLYPVHCWEVSLTVDSLRWMTSHCCQTAE